MKEYLKKNWKPLTFWSGLGGLFFGGALLAVKRRKQYSTEAIMPLPKRCRRVLLRMTTSELRYDEEFPAVCSVYELHPTGFRVWNAMEGKSHGMKVYYVTSRRVVQTREGEERSIPSDPFYAVVGIRRYTKKADLPDHVRKGSPVAFRLCLVGGEENGIPTGETIVTQGVLESWEVE